MTYWKATQGLGLRTTQETDARILALGGGVGRRCVHAPFAVSRSQLCPHQLVDLDRALAAKILVFPLVKWK